MNLVVYGDFNCPYSRLASHRVDRLVAAGRGRAEWRAVQHEPGLPAEGRPVEGELAERLVEEIDEVAGLMADDETVTLRRPPQLPSTAAATAALAAADPADRPELRRRLFDALWLEGMDLGDERTLASLGIRPGGAAGPAADWQAAWEELDESLVPAMVTPDGTVRTGIAALDELRRRLEGR